MRVEYTRFPVGSPSEIPPALSSQCSQVHTGLTSFRTRPRQKIVMKSCVASSMLLTLFYRSGMRLRSLIVPHDRYAEVAHCGSGAALSEQARLLLKSSRSTSLCFNDIEGRLQACLLMTSNSQGSFWRGYDFLALF